MAAQSRNVNFVKNLSQSMETCFRGEALRWWNDELDTLTRRGLVHADAMDEWSEILQKRFKTPPGQAWSNLDSTRYTLDDVRNKKSVAAYVLSLASAAKQCGAVDEFPIVIRVWKHLDLSLRHTIDEPIEGTTIKDFMERLVRKQSNWFDTYEQRRDTRQYDYEHQQSLNRLRPITETYDRASVVSPLSSSFGNCAQEAPKLPEQTRSPPQLDVGTGSFGDGHKSFDAMAEVYNANALFVQAIKRPDKLVVVPRETHLGILSEDQEVSMVKSDVVLDFSHPAPGQYRVQESTKSLDREPRQLPTPKQPLLLAQQCQHYDPGKPDPRNRWHRDPPQRTPRSSTVYAAKEGAFATTEIAMSIAKNDLKVVTVPSSDSHQNAFWRDHGEHVGRPEDHG
jgi:hypothetical protein